MGNPPAKLCAVVAGSSAWAPGVTTPEELEAWIAAPRALERDGHPQAKFLPAMLRRRCKPLTRIMLTAAYGCCTENELATVRTVFSSRHGSINESIGLLEAIAESKRVSAATFAHTVHNAQAGLFSIAAANRQASSSLAGQEASFPTGFLEALTHLNRAPQRKVLLVTGDVPLAETFASLIDEAQVSYGTGLLLASDGEGPGVSLALEPRTSADAPPSPTPWPAAFEFLRWLHSEEPDLTIPTQRTNWQFRRAD